MERPASQPRPPVPAAAFSPGPGRVGDSHHWPDACLRKVLPKEGVKWPVKGQGLTTPHPEASEARALVPLPSLQVLAEHGRWGLL
jgi:hypothetical protein